MHHFGALAICAFNIKGAHDGLDFPVPSHLGSKFPAVGTDNHTISPTQRVPGDALPSAALLQLPD